MGNVQGGALWMGAAFALFVILAQLNETREPRHNDVR
jgi:hypothetical protein